MKALKYLVVTGSAGGNELTGHFIVNPKCVEEFQNTDNYTVRYTIINFEFKAGSGIFKGNSGYLEKNIGSGMTAYSLHSGNENFSGDYEKDVTGFTDDFKTLPDCMTLFKRLQATDDPIPGVGNIDADKLGQYKIQFTKDEEVDFLEKVENVHIVSG